MRRPGAAWRTMGARWRDRGRRLAGNDSLTRCAVANCKGESVPPVEPVRFAARCARVRASEVAVLDLEAPGSPAQARIDAEIALALREDRAEAIVLGCAGMAPLCRTLSQRLGVPVIDGVAVAVKWGEALASLGLGTSKAGDYALPLPKTYTGWAKPFGW